MRVMRGRSGCRATVPDLRPCRLFGDPLPWIATLAMAALVLTPAARAQQVPWAVPDAPVRAVEIAAKSPTNPDAGSAISVPDFGLVKQGGGILALTGSNTYSGGTTISQGTLAVGSAQALGTGNVVNHGVLMTAGGSHVITISANYTQGS